MLVILGHKSFVFGWSGVRGQKEKNKDRGKVVRGQEKIIDRWTGVKKTKPR